MNTENKVTISQRIFTLVRDVPGLTTEDIHEKLSVDTKYKTSSGKQIIYRLVRSKYIRKNKDGKLFAKIGEYRPLPPVVKKKKRVVKADPAMNAYNCGNRYNQNAATANVQPEPKPVTGGFLGSLGRRISAYFK
jgi:ribosomal protein S16